MPKLSFQETLRDKAGSHPWIQTLASGHDDLTPLKLSRVRGVPATDTQLIDDLRRVAYLNLKHEQYAASFLGRQICAVSMQTLVRWMPAWVR